MSIFNQVAVKKPRFNTFDLSHEHKTTCGMGRIVPVFMAETVPNDYFRISTSQLVRLAPMVAPVMHRFSVYIHYFFVPYRILWTNFPKFINGGVTGEDTPTFPFVNLTAISAGNRGIGSLPDYLGIPVDQTLPNPLNISAMPFAAYQKIYWEFYRDQNLYNEDTGAPIAWVAEDSPLDDGDNSTKALYYGLQNRAWEHDYFTSALPWTQRGPEATIPLGSVADINWDDSVVDPSIIRVASTGLPYGSLDTLNVNDGPGGTGDLFIQNAGIEGIVDNSHNLYADLSTATAATINDLRRAFRLQEWLELNARAGSRYNEMIIAHFGISPGDARLQRPQFLGGSASPIKISEVLQTSGTGITDQATPLATMAGHGVSIGGKNVVKYRCKEHGIIMGLMSIRPKSAYQQGLHKMWTKFDKFDYFWRSFANIGEQPILNKEIYVANDGLNDDVFGYTPRYAEYKYLNDRVSGEFRTSRDFWHAGRKFSARPVLNHNFVTCFASEMDRIFAVESDYSAQCLVQMYHNVKATRPMPYFGSPTL